MTDDIKRIVFNQETEEDQVVSLSLRPERLSDFVGQRELVANLNVALQATKQRKEPLEHMLFSGPPGLGKTSLANIIANEMGARITVTSGPAIERAGDFIGILTNLEKAIFFSLMRFTACPRPLKNSSIRPWRISRSILSSTKARTPRPLILI